MNKFKEINIISGIPCQSLNSRLHVRHEGKDCSVLWKNPFGLTILMEGMGVEMRSLSEEAEWGTKKHSLNHDITLVIDNQLQKTLPEQEAIKAAYPILDKYEVCGTEHQHAVLWRRNSEGELVNGSVVFVDRKTLEINDAIPVVRYLPKRVFQYWTTTGFFGGGLIRIASTIYVTTSEANALRKTCDFWDDPHVACVAIGYGQSLTEEHLTQLQNKSVILLATPEEYEGWQAFSKRFHNVEVERIV